MNRTQQPRTDHWTTGRIVLAYAAMTLLALASVWIVDRKVHLLPARDSQNPASPTSR
ncbi:hypothetical protein [Fontivita pretiosa]|uniref:hypothetical protein n=1 Tax=Fontivita pretiosa TaxID=2989684 RepID=UPI003D175A01